MTTSDYLEQLQQDREDLVDNLETKGITGLTGDETFTELVPEVLNIPSGGSTEPEEKDVNFYDYDGTRVYSYTKNEFLALEEMPGNPSHEGLTAEGWNWDLTDAKTHVMTYNELDIGQLYKTDDDKTRIYITLEDKTRLSPYLCFNANGNATIEWGDGTSDTATNGNIAKQHTYSNIGDYVIKISCNDGFTITGASSGNTSTILGYNNDISSSNFDDLYYLNCIKKIELSSNCNVRDKAFASCNKLEMITIPNNLPMYRYLFYMCNSLKSIIIPNSGTSILERCFYQCINIKHIIIPSGITTIGNYCFQQCYNLEKIILPESITNIGTSYASTFDNCMLVKDIILSNNITNIPQNGFSNNKVITKVKMPSNVSKIYPNVFNGCPSILYYDFSESEAVPTLDNTNAIGGGSACKIIVPDDLYEDWIIATNWSSLSSKIIKKTDWDALNS